MNNQDARFLDLLHKWQSGDFTRSDEREMDALTEADDFRRETWEGFAAQPDAAHEQNLAALRLRLRQQAGLGQTRRVGLPMMWAAAASLVLLVAAVLFFRKNTTPEAAAVIADNAAPAVASEPSPAFTPDPAHSSDIASAEPQAPSRSLNRSLDKSSPRSTAAAPEGIADYAVASKSADNMKEAEVDDRFANVPLDPIIKADSKLEEPGGSATDKQAERVVSTESAKKKATTVPVAKPTTPAPAPTKPDTAWSKTGTPPDMAKRRKEAREASNMAQSEPADGWEAFQEYLRQTARLTPAARNKGVSGTVRLRFNINANGDPQGFITLRSLGYGCDQEAIRLVKDWVWVRGQNPTVTVEIPFVR